DGTTGCGFVRSQSNLLGEPLLVASAGGRQIDEVGFREILRVGGACEEFNCALCRVPRSGCRHHTYVVDALVRQTAYIRAAAVKVNNLVAVRITATGLNSVVA